MSDIHIFPGQCSSPDALLEHAREQGLDSVVILGWKDGAFYISQSHEFCKDTLWDLEVAKQDLMG
jgi:hypothetical protein